MSGLYFLSQAWMCYDGHPTHNMLKIHAYLVLNKASNKYYNMSALGERSVRIREVEGSNPFRSTKQGSDEHLFLQRRFRRAVFALIRNRKAPSWK